MIINRHKKGGVTDALMLTFVRVVTAVLGLVCTRIISDGFSFQDYGTYSQAMLLNSTITAITILGLTDAVNLYYNKYISQQDVQIRIVSNIFSLQIIIGIFAAFALIFFKESIVTYFSNTSLRPLILLIAVMPMMGNLLAMQQTLYVSIGKVDIVAKRNLIISVLRLVIFIVACYVTGEVGTILFFQLICDVAQVLYFGRDLKKKGIEIKIFTLNFSWIKKILKFSIPVSAFVVTSSLLRDSDKYIVSCFTDASTLAIFSNASKILPLDMFVASLTTVLLPIITRSVATNDKLQLQLIYRGYFNVSMAVGVILVGAAVVSAPSLMTLLYGEKYLVGLNVFIIYLFVTLVRFVNLALLFNAAGKSMIILVVSLIALILNIGLSVILMYWLGPMGCAIGTLVVSILINVAMMFMSKSILGKSAFVLIDWKWMARLLLLAIVCSIICYSVNSAIGINVYAFVIISIVYVGLMVILNWKRFNVEFKNLNKYKI